jgi:sialidase-1
MESQVLAARGIGGYRQYRIPAMAVTPSGRIIVLFDGRADFDDLPGPIDLLIRISDDNGLNWSEQKEFRKHEGISGFGDASIVIDPTYGAAGRILVFYQATKLAGFFESDFGSEIDNPQISHIALAKSDDDGMTWSHEIVTGQLKDQGTQGIFASSGMGGQIKIGAYAGRLLQTFVLRREKELLSAIAYSDDHGDTWHLGAEIAGGNETAIAGLDDGSVMVHSRARPFRLSGISLDGGSTLNSLVPDIALPDPSDNGSLTSLRSGALICTHNHDSDLRHRTVLKRSFDSGRTWPEVVLLEAESSAYSTACELADGTIGVLFERHAYTELVFSRINAQDFSDTQELLGKEVFSGDIEFIFVPRYIRPGRKEISSIPRLQIQPKVPVTDMSQWPLFERKEVGPVGGSTSGDSLFTSAEYDLMLGLITPGLHLDDEIRISGRFANHKTASLHNVKILDSFGNLIEERGELLAAERIVFLDVRQLVSAYDLAKKSVDIRLKWSANTSNTGLKDTTLISGEFTKIISTETGLPVTTN